MGDEGLDSPPENTGNTRFSGERNVKSNARPSGTDHNPAEFATGDPLLDRLLIAWEHLADGDRLGMVEQVERLASMVNTPVR
jgi:hypothetical protein